MKGLAHSSLQKTAWGVGELGRKMLTVLVFCCELRQYHPSLKAT